MSPPRPTAVPDANVLFGILSTDLLITTAAHGLYIAQWSERILNEAHRNIEANRPDIDPKKIGSRFQAMRRALPSAMTDPPDPRFVASMTNHQGDRHVLATAIQAGAELIVTENLRHFQPGDCEPYGVAALGLDDFVVRLIQRNRQGVIDAIDEMANRRTKPPATSIELLNHLKSRTPNAARLLFEN